MFIILFDNIHELQYLYKFENEKNGFNINR